LTIIYVLWAEWERDYQSIQVKINEKNIPLYISREYMKKGNLKALNSDQKRTQNPT